MIPSNHRWFRDLEISHIITRSLENLDMKLPKPAVDLAEIARKDPAAAEEQGARDEMNISGRKLTCLNNLHGDAINMGPVYVDQKVVVDGDLVTPAWFARRIIDLLGQR